MLVNVGRKSFSNRIDLAAVIDSTDDFLNSYTYDALNRLTRLDQSATGSASVAEKRVDFTYNAIGQFTSIARFNDTDGGSGEEVATSTYSYDTLGRLTDLAYKHGGTNLFAPYQWTYDNLNRVTQFVSADGTSDYTYDKTSQLTAADHDYQTDESYTYDANGNRTMSGYSTGDNNQLLNDGTYSYTYTYDDEGNRLTRTNDTTYEVTEYEWDFRNRLVKVTEKDYMGVTTQVVEYTYDVFNRRIAKAVDTTSPFTLADAAIERYVYDDLNGVTSVDGGNVVLDFLDPDGSGSSPSALRSRQLFGHAVDQILAQEDVSEPTSSADRVLWHLGDHLATVRDFAKNDGTLGEHYTYDSYGNIVSGDTSVTRYLFTSREYDPATGLQYNRARWYDPAAGRWMSEDPLGFAAGDANVSRYVHNSSVYVSDPSGLRDPDENEKWPTGPRPPWGGDQSDWDKYYNPTPTPTDWERIYMLEMNEEMRRYLEGLQTTVAAAPNGATIEYIDWFGEFVGFDPYPESESGAGWCAAWTHYVDAHAPMAPEGVNTVIVEWEYTGIVPIYSGHSAIRVGLTLPDDTIEVFYLDNFLIGGSDHALFPEDVLPEYINEFPPISTPVAKGQYRLLKNPGGSDPALSDEVFDM